VRGPDWTLIEAAEDATALKVIAERLDPADPAGRLARLGLVPLLLETSSEDRTNRSAEHPDVEAGLREALSAWEFMQYGEIHRFDQAAVPREQLDERELERLRALGYL